MPIIATLEMFFPSIATFSMKSRDTLGFHQETWTKVPLQWTAANKGTELELPQANTVSADE